MTSGGPQFDGERDTKGPPDFNNNNKADEPMDEDDEGDEDDSSQKRRDSKAAKVKSETSTNSIVPIRPGPPSNDVSASPEVRSHPSSAPPCCPHMLTARVAYHRSSGQISACPRRRARHRRQCPCRVREIGRAHV